MEAARPAVADDLPALARLAECCVAELGPQRGGDLWSRRDFRARPFETTLARDLADASSLVIVGTFDDVVLGYLVVISEALRDGDRLAVMTDLYVEPPARGVGVGEAMMDLALDRCRAAGFRGLDASVLPGNRATKNFFERYGIVARAIVVHLSFQGATPA